MRSIIRNANCFAKNAEDLGGARHMNYQQRPYLWKVCTTASQTDRDNRASVDAQLCSKTINSVHSQRPRSLLADSCLLVLGLRQGWAKHDPQTLVGVQCACKYTIIQ